MMCYHAARAMSARKATTPKDPINPRQGYERGVNSIAEWSQHLAAQGMQIVVPSVKSLGSR